MASLQEPFFGLIYANGFATSPSCRAEGTGSRLLRLALNSSECGIHFIQSEVRVVLKMTLLLSLGGGKAKHPFLIDINHIKNWDKLFFLLPCALCWLYKSCQLPKVSLEIDDNEEGGYILSHVEKYEGKVFVRRQTCCSRVHNSSHGPFSFFLFPILQLFMCLKNNNQKISKLFLNVCVCVWESQPQQPGVSTDWGWEYVVDDLRRLGNRMDRDSWNCRCICSTTTTFNRPLMRRWRPAVGYRLLKNRVQSHRWRNHRRVCSSGTRPFSLCSRRADGETRPARRPRPSRTRFCRSVPWWITRWPQQLLRLESFRVFL